MLKYAVSPRGVCTVETKVCVHGGCSASPAKLRAKNITTILLIVGFSFDMMRWFFYFLRFFQLI